MNIQNILLDVLSEQCESIHSSRLSAVLDVAEGLRNSQNLSLSAIGRKLSGEAKVKHKIKKVDRCLGNKHLYNEVHSLYSGLSHLIFQHLKCIDGADIVIDLCYLKDDRMVQMLSAGLCTKGMTLPLYQEVFEDGELKGKTVEFLDKLRSLVPSNKTVVIIMDAGFHVEWFRAVERHGWNWICRIRQGKDLKIQAMEEWVSVKNYIPLVDNRTKDQGPALLTKGLSFNNFLNY